MNKKHRYDYTVHIIFVCLLLFLLIGCENAREVEDSKQDYSKEIETAKEIETSEEGGEQSLNQIISCEKFMEYYGISENDVPKEYVEAFIWEYLIRDDITQKDEKKVFGTQVQTDYKNGVKYGVNLGKIFRGPSSQLPIDEYMKNADIISIEFGLKDETGTNQLDMLVIDLKNQKMYQSNNNISDSNYTNIENAVNLSEEDVKAIREELPSHISEDGQGNYGVSKEYSFIIRMKADDYSTKFFNGDCGDELHFPGFDDYWKSLYKKYFDITY